MISCDVGPLIFPYPLQIKVQQISFLRNMANLCHWLCFPSTSIRKEKTKCLSRDAPSPGEFSPNASYTKTNLGKILLGHTNTQMKIHIK